MIVGMAIVVIVVAVAVVCAVVAVEVGSSSSCGSSNSFVCSSNNIVRYLVRCMLFCTYGIITAMGNSRFS